MFIPKVFFCINIKLKNDDEWHHFVDEQELDLVKIIVSNLKVNPEVVAIQVHRCAIRAEVTIDNWIRENKNEEKENTI